MTSEELISTINKLSSGGADSSLPGLELEAVVDNFIDVKYGKDLEACKDEEQRKKLCDQWKEYYTKGDGSTQIQLEIATIKSSYNNAESQLKSIRDGAISAVASNSIPSVITTGSAASVPNPSYTLIENKTKKMQLQAQLNSVSGNLIEILKSASKISYSVPDSVVGLIDTFGDVKNSVDSIPV